MFYCDDCGRKNGWPTEFYLVRSIGPCEVCEETHACYDVPSSHLPARALPSSPMEPRK